MKLATDSNPILTVFVSDDSGKGITGLVAATFPSLFYAVNGASATMAFPSLIDLALITSSYVAGGIKERAGGYYRVDAPTGITATEGASVTLMGEGTNQHVICPPLEIGAVTVAAIRQEIDTNSSRLAMTATVNDVAAASASILAAVGSPLQGNDYVVPPSAISIAAATAASLFVDGPVNLLKVNPDHSVNSTSSGTIANYITIPPAVAVASQDAAVIPCVRGDTLRAFLPLMGNLTDRIKLTLTVKSSINDVDAAAVLQVIEGAGLVRLNGRVAADTAYASLTVTDALTGAVKLVVDASVTARLAAQDLIWDCQAILPTGVISPVCGTLMVIPDVTQAVS